jgi:CHAT domain-containing protein
VPRLNGIRRLIIIPDEELSLFPFETLIRKDSTGAEVPEATGTNSSSLHYLIRDFEIAYHLSAEAWYRDTANTGLLQTSYRFAGFAPVFGNTPGKPGSLNPLPFALKEVAGIAGLFGQVPGHQPVFLDTSATERNFRSYAPGNTHIHIATHSLISEGNPMNSALVFSISDSPAGQQDKNDGLLHLDEVGNLQLDASLVVLSACATGEGKVTHTEGVLALTRGFYLAGAANVVYSLWNIPDHLTGDFMLSFYRSYFSGKSYSAALREVKLKMISRPETSLPYMWAGIVMLGK